MQPLADDGDRDGRLERQRRVAQERDSIRIAQGKRHRDQPDHVRDDHEPRKDGQRKRSFHDSSPRCADGRIARCRPGTAILSAFSTSRSQNATPSRHARAAPAMQYAMNGARRQARRRAEAMQRAPARAIALSCGQNRGRGAQWPCASRACRRKRVAPLGGARNPPPGWRAFIHRAAAAATPRNRAPRGQSPRPAATRRPLRPHRPSRYRRRARIAHRSRAPRSTASRKAAPR